MIGVEVSNDVLFVGIELICSVWESPSDSLSILQPGVHLLTVHGLKF